MNVSLKGIASMQKNVKKTSVIYAVPGEGDGRLRSLCSTFSHFNFGLQDLLQSKFKDAEFLENDKHSSHEVLVCSKMTRLKSKLHCTLLNTLHMKPRPKKYAAVIDATELFESEEIKEYDFGEVDIEEVQICEMGVKDVDGEIRYKSVGGFSLTSMEEKTTDVLARGKGLEEEWLRSHIRLQ